MRVLVGIAYYGHAKAYCRPLFEIMMREILKRSLFEVDVAWATDLGKDSAPDYADFVFAGTPGYTYCDDMLSESHEWMLELANERGYDRLVWQGTDMIYEHPWDFDKLVASCVAGTAVSALVAARSDENTAVARRFVHDGLGFTREQFDIPLSDLDSKADSTGVRKLVPAGYPSSDNLVISKELFGIRQPDFIPWYIQAAHGFNFPLCYEESWCKKAVEAGFGMYVNPNVLPWHVHDVDMLARKWRRHPITYKEVLMKWILYQVRFSAS